MKNVFRTCAVGAAIVAASALNAASVWSEKVAIPFDFQVSKTTMPAGEYRVSRSAGSDIAFLINVQTGKQVQVLRNVAASVEGKARIVFETTANGHVLKTIS